jgi:hypothetical protein
VTGPELATLSTIGWVVLTLAFLIVFGTWSAGEGWSILPGLVRGVRDWAAEHVASRATSPSPWVVTLPPPAAAPPASEVREAVDTGVEIVELWTRPTQQ